jgi:hypothetical protein
VGSGTEGKKRGPQVVNIAEYHDKEHDERKEFLLERIADLRKLVEDGRLTSILLEYEAEAEEEGADYLEGGIVFWDRTESIDVAISKCARLQQRLCLMADGFIGHE